ncbi:MAG TPA: MFS transporter [Pseudonocardiaceae bacterium]
MNDVAGRPAPTARAIVFPLALAQFICTYAGSSLNVAISPIAKDLHTTVFGIQAVITLFTLTMAALMIPGSKLTDIWGRKTCFVTGLVIYGVGALLSALTPGLGLMIVGNSLLEGVGCALLIPPIYILITVLFPDVRTRARYFGVISGAAGLGAALGPLIGGLVTSYITWRASFLLQVLVVLLIAVLTRRLVDPPLPEPRPRFDVLGAILSAAGLFLVVLGVLMTGTHGWKVVSQAGGVSPVWLLIGTGVVILAGFLVYIHLREKAGKDPLFSIGLFRNRTSNLGLITQNFQWLVLQGAFFVIAVFLQEVRGYSAIDTGLMLLPATVGILLASAAAERMAGRHSQRRLVRGGFGITTIGIALLLALVRSDSSVASFVPGLLLLGIGIGIMLTASVNLVQSSSPEAVQGDISGVSRSVSNLGSSLGTALAGSILVGAVSSGGRAFAFALGTLGVVALLGLITAIVIPREPQRSTSRSKQEPSS